MKCCRKPKQFVPTGFAQVSGRAPSKIIADINRFGEHIGDVQPFGSYDSSVGVSAGGATSISITGRAAGANELAVVAASGVANVGNVAGQSPGAGWTGLASNIAWWKVFASAGPVTATQALSGNLWDSVQALCLFVTNGLTPVFTLRGSGSGGANPLNIGPFTPAAGNSLLFMSQVSAGAFGTAIWSASDNAGNLWALLQQMDQRSTDQGNQHQASVRLLYAQNIAGASTTVSVANDVPGLIGNWALYEISNLSNVASGAYTFQASDAGKLVQFAGGANVTGTLPSPALATGWQALASIIAPGVLTITPAPGVLLNRSTNSVTIRTSSSAWVWSDGTNYWSTSTS